MNSSSRHGMCSSLLWITGKHEELVQWWPCQSQTWGRGNESFAKWLNRSTHRFKPSSGLVSCYLTALCYVLTANKPIFSFLCDFPEKCVKKLTVNGNYSGTTSFTHCNHSVKMTYCLGQSGSGTEPADRQTFLSGWKPIRVCLRASLLTCT